MSRNTHLDPMVFPHVFKIQGNSGADPKTKEHTSIYIHISIYIKRLLPKRHQQELDVGHRFFLQLQELQPIDGHRQRGLRGAATWRSEGGQNPRPFSCEASCGCVSFLGCCPPPPQRGGRCFFLLVLPPLIQDNPCLCS